MDTGDDPYGVGVPGGGSPPAGPSPLAPGWYPDQRGMGGERYFDGSSWTAYRKLDGPPPVHEPPTRPKAPAQSQLEHGRPWMTYWLEIAAMVAFMIAIWFTPYSPRPLIQYGWNLLTGNAGRSYLSMVHTTAPATRTTTTSKLEAAGHEICTELKSGETPQDLMAVLIESAQYVTRAQERAWAAGIKAATKYYCPSAVSTTVAQLQIVGIERRYHLRRT